MEKDQLTLALRAVGEPKRLELLRRVAELEKSGEVTCNCLREGCEVSQSTMSHHISTLVEAGLLRSENRGKFVLLSVDHDALKELAVKLGTLGD